MVFRLPPLGLLQLASLTPTNWEVALIDENEHRLDFDTPTDLVALTAMTTLAPRAYSIAREYKKRGVPVIMGGIHASILPDEALKHVDSVVIGEADEIWPTILSDFNSENLKKIYKVEQRPNLASLPQPSRIIPRYAYYPLAKVPLIQTSRGCPFGCDFCSVSNFNGKRIRHRPVEQVIENIKRFTHNQNPLRRYFIFTDDNIVADVKYAAKLFKELIPLRVRWLSQADIRIALDKDLLKLAVASGLSTAFIGFESINKETLAREISRVKAHWSGSYEEGIRRLIKAGVGIEGAFIFGLDNQDANIFKRTVDWAIKNHIAAAQFTTLTPFPGTKLFERLKREKRITARSVDGNYDWEKFNAFEVVFQPAKMNAEALQSGVTWAYKAFYSHKATFQRLKGALSNINAFEKLLFGLVNLNFHYSFRI